MCALQGKLGPGQVSPGIRSQWPNWATQADRPVWKGAVVGGI